MDTARTIAKKLLQINAIKLSPQQPFTWASGIKSPIYCDNRTILSYPEVRREVIAAFVSRSADFRPFNLVAGVATAGVPHGALLASELDLPFVYVRDKAKSHGRQNQIEGFLRGAERALVIEDLISTGGSSLKAVEALREAGCTVAGVLAIFSYGFSEAEEAFRAADCPFDSLSQYDVLLDEAISSGFIHPDEENMLRQWRRSPHSWGSGQ